MALLSGRILFWRRSFPRRATRKLRPIHDGLIDVESGLNHAADTDSRRKNAKLLPASALCRRSVSLNSFFPDGDRFQEFQIEVESESRLIGYRDCAVRRYLNQRNNDISGPVPTARGHVSREREILHG